MPAQRGQCTPTPSPETGAVAWARLVRGALVSIQHQGTVNGIMGQAAISV